MSETTFHKPLHIGFIVDRFSLLERASKHGFLIPVVKGLSEKGYRITIISGLSSQPYSFDEKELSEKNLNVYFVKGSGRRLEVQFRKKVLEIHEKTPFDLMHVVSKNSLFMIKLKKIYKFPVVLDARSTEVSQLYSIMGMNSNTFGGEIKTGLVILYKFFSTFYTKDRSFLKMADALIVTSPQEKNIFERYYFYPDRKTFVLPYGIELVKTSVHRKEALMKNLNLSSDHQIIATVTNMLVKEELSPILKIFSKTRNKKTLFSSFNFRNRSFKKGN